MNKILFFFAILLTGCTQPVITKTVIIFDTLETQQHRDRIRYQLPEGYNIVKDTASGKYMAAYWLNDQYVYLKDYQLTVLFFYNGPQYADKFDKPSQVVPLIQKHWAEILADRATHTK